MNLGGYHVYKVMIFENGMLAVFNDANEQVPELQKPWLELILEFLQSKGISPDECSFESNKLMMLPFKRDDGSWSWEATKK